MVNSRKCRWKTLYCTATETQQSAKLDDTRWRRVRTAAIKIQKSQWSRSLLPVRRYACALMSRQPELTVSHVHFCNDLSRSFCGQQSPTTGCQICMKYEKIVPFNIYLTPSQKPYKTDPCKVLPRANASQMPQSAILYLQTVCDVWHSNIQSKLLRPHIKCRCANLRMCGSAKR